MVRYSFACRGQAKDAEEEIDLEEEEIDITKAQQLTEHYFCNINANGEVSTMQRCGVLSTYSSLREHHRSQS